MYKRLFLDLRVLRTAPQMLKHLQQNARPPATQDAISISDGGPNCANTAAENEIKTQAEQGNLKLESTLWPTTPQCATDSPAAYYGKAPTHHSNQRPERAISKYVERYTDPTPLAREEIYPA